jgi:(R,R)-butanediol dehydrogenase / meso-butanediol dehydrogenase / diacetyl reductase
VRVGVYRGIKHIAVEEASAPVAGANDVVLDVRACGICGSDLHVYLAGKLAQPGMILGHEFAGEVAAVGAAVEGIAVGDRVTGMPLQSCGECVRCREGNAHLCELTRERLIGFGLPGGFAEQLRIPDARLGENVHRLPEELDFEAGAFVEPLGVCVHAVRRSGAQPGERALVLGLGTIGLLVAQVLRAYGVEEVYGTDLSELRRDRAAELGIRVEEPEGDLDHVLECTGAPSMIQRAIERVRPRGTVTVVALYDETATIDPMTLVHRETKVVGTAMITPDDFREAIELLRSGRVVGAPLITHRRPLADLPAAFELQCDKDATIKVMVAP